MIVGVSGELRKKAQASLDRVLAYLEKRAHMFAIDTVFQLRVIQGFLPDSIAGKIADASVTDLAKRDVTALRLKKMWQAPVKPMQSRIKLDDVKPASKDVIENCNNDAFNEHQSDVCIANAMDCKSWSKECKVFETKPACGYWLTHEFAYFHFLAMCPPHAIAPPVPVQSWLDLKMKGVYAEFLAYDGALMDLQAERILLGAMSGNPEFLTTKWIASIIATQTKGGCWSEPGAMAVSDLQYDLPSGDECEFHFTGMAAGVLATFLHYTA